MSEQGKINKVAFLQQTPSIMLALSKELNSIIVFEAIGKQKFSCKQAGLIKFPDTHSVKHLALQQNPSALYASFENSKSVAIFTYNELK